MKEGENRSFNIPEKLGQVGEALKPQRLVERWRSLDSNIKFCISMTGIPLGTAIMFSSLLAEQGTQFRMALVLIGGGLAIGGLLKAAIDSQNNRWEQNKQRIISKQNWRDQMTF